MADETQGVPYGDAAAREAALDELTATAMQKLRQRVEGATSGFGRGLASGVADIFGAGGQANEAEGQQTIMQIRAAIGANPDVPVTAILASMQPQYREGSTARQVVDESLQAAREREQTTGTRTLREDVSLRQRQGEPHRGPTPRPEGTLASAIEGDDEDQAPAPTGGGGGGAPAPTTAGVSFGPTGRTSISDEIEQPPSGAQLPTAAAQARDLEAASRLAEARRLGTPPPGTPPRQLPIGTQASIANALEDIAFEQEEARQLANPDPATTGGGGVPARQVPEVSIEPSIADAVSPSYTEGNMTFLAPRGTVFDTPAEQPSAGWGDLLGGLWGDLVDAITPEEQVEQNVPLEDIISPETASYNPWSANIPAPRTVPGTGAQVAGDLKTLDRARIEPRIGPSPPPLATQPNYRDRFGAESVPDRSLPPNNITIPNDGYGGNAGGLVGRPEYSDLPALQEPNWADRFGAAAPPVDRSLPPNNITVPTDGYGGNARPGLVGQPEYSDLVLPELDGGRQLPSRGRGTGFGPAGVGAPPGRLDFGEPDRVGPQGPSRSPAPQRQERPDPPGAAGGGFNTGQTSPWERNIPERRQTGTGQYVPGDLYTSDRARDEVQRSRTTSRTPSPTAPSRFREGRRAVGPVAPATRIGSSVAGGVANSPTRLADIYRYGGPTRPGEEAPPEEPVAPPRPKPTPPPPPPPPPVVQPQPAPRPRPKPKPKPKPPPQSTLRGQTIVGYGPSGPIIRDDRTGQTYQGYVGGAPGTGTRVVDTYGRPIGRGGGSGSSGGGAGSK